MNKNNKANKPTQAQPSSKPSSKKENKESKLQKLVKNSEHFEFIQNGKIKCTLTGHEFAPTLQNYEEYLKSKSYKRGLESQFDISQYEDFLAPYKGNDHFLFCRLTAVKIPKKKTAIERHVNSRKFKTRMQQVLNDKQEEGQEQQLIEEQEEEQSEEQAPKNGKKSKK